MAYTNRPFNYTGTLPNQVQNDLDLANDNFDILGQAFIGNHPSSQPIKRAVYIGATPPSDAVASTLWFDTSVSPPVLKVYNGTNWQLVSSPNADTVDGFHASQTPAPNVIVPLNANGILDLSASYVKSNVYTFRRVDLTNATSDYMLQVGEEAIIMFDNKPLVPLRVAIQEPSTPLSPVIYNIIIGIYWASGNNMDFDFFPNNTTYSGQVQILGYRHSVYGWDNYLSILDKFGIDAYGGADDFPFFVNLFAVYYTAQQPKLLYGNVFSRLSLGLYSGIWNNTSTAWTSLGSFRIYPGFTRNISGIALVRRLA